MERYYNFWRRLGAGIFDSLVLLLISYLIFKYLDLGASDSYFLLSIIAVFIYFLYSVLLTGLVGQTIGKIVMGIIVLDVDEKKVIGIKRAFYRDSIPILMEVLALLYLGYYTFIKNSVTSNSIYIVNEITENARFYWFFAEIVTMFFNDKRRALHDFLASSVVISFKGKRIDEHYEKVKAQRRPVSH